MQRQVLVIVFAILSCSCVFLKPSEATITRQSLPGLVTIEALGPNGEKLKTGSGFILNNAGAVVTNEHVVAGASVLQVILNSGEKILADGLIHVDADKDFAVLKIAAPRLNPLPLSRWDDVVQGSRVLALGSPLGLDKTVTDGIVSQVRNDENRTLIQHTAAISPGSSGGPLLDDRGRVIGINTLMLKEGQSLYFALPVRYIRPYASNSDVNISIAEYANEAKKKRQEQVVAQLKKLVTLYEDQEGYAQFLVPRNYTVSRSAGMEEGQTERVVIMAHNPNAERAKTNGWLSDGIRLSMRITSEGKVWKEEHRATWPKEEAQRMVQSYSRHSILSAKEGSLAGLQGMLVHVRGEAPEISKTEESFLYTLTAPRCLVTIEVVMPAEDSDALSVVNTLLADSLKTRCAQ
jgi:hypothetical protein